MAVWIGEILLLPQFTIVATSDVYRAPPRVTFDPTSRYRVRSRSRAPSINAYGWGTYLEPVRPPLHAGHAAPRRNRTARYKRKPGTHRPRDAVASSAAG